jgi:hypothetical protein
VSCTISGVFIWWIASGKVKTGWIMEHADTSNGAPASIVLREAFVAVSPAFVSSLLSHFSFNADILYGSSAPLAGMFVPHDARQNILLDYLSPDPVTVLVTSLANGHWRVAYFVLLSLIGPYMTVFAANIFQIRKGDEVDYLTLIPANLHVCLGVVSLYIISYIIARPPVQNRFPRTIVTIIELLSYCSESSLLTAKEFSVQVPDDQEIHLQSKIHLAKRKYYFGFYRGKDGMRHLGFEASEFSGLDHSGRIASNVHPVVPEKYPCFLFWRPWWIGSRRHQDCRPRLALLLAQHDQGTSAGQAEEGSGLVRVHGSPATTREFTDDESDDESQIRPFRHVDTLMLEAGLGHRRRESRTAAGSSGVTRFQQNHSLQQRAPTE